MTNDAKRDNRPEGSAALTAVLMTSWFACTQQAIVAAAAGHTAEINKNAHPKYGSVNLHYISIK
jgi:hypothetical protein